MKSQGSGAKRLRVCFPFVGDDVGGSHISALKLIQNLDPRRIDPVIVLQDGAGPLAAFLRGQKQKFTTLPVQHSLSPRGDSHGTTLSFARTTLPLLVRFIKQGAFDIVHTNDGRVHVNWGLAARIAGARLVWHHRGDPDARGVNLLAPLIAHQIVTVSRFARPRKPIRSVADRTTVIHSPFDAPVAEVDRTTAKQNLLAELGLAPGTRVLSFVGNLIERKRPLLFVDVIARFRKRYPEIPVVGCLFGVGAPGGGDYEAAARMKASSEAGKEAVHFMGFRNPIEPYIAATDVLVVPAVGEPFGRTLIEAMFLGTPVVATNHGGNPEAIRDGQNGFLVEAENADAFLEPLKRLLTDAALHRTISLTAEEQARQSFSARRHADQIQAVYQKALQPRSTALIAASSAKHFS